MAKRGDEVVTPPEHAAEGSSLVVRDVTKTFRAADGSAVAVLDRLSLAVAREKWFRWLGRAGAASPRCYD